MDCVIIGAGAAGMQTAAACREQWPDRQVTVVDAEAEVGYYRTLIPQFINRSLTEDKLFFWNQKNDPQLQVLSGVAVESVDRTNRAIHLSSGQKIHYGRLVIASGGRPVVPSPCQIGKIRGIFPVRSLAAARLARDWLQTNPEVVILGGGLVGVKMAAHLAGFDIPVTLIEREPQLLPQALSPEAARAVAEHLDKKNIRLLLGYTIEDLQVAGGSIRAVRVDDSWLDCRTLFVAAGSVPELGFLTDSGLLVENRLEVTASLQTLDSSVFGAGDAVTIVDEQSHTPWTWPQAMVQGKLAAANIYAQAPRNLERLTRVNTMNLNGLSLAILGVPVSDAARTTWGAPDSNVYRELFVRDGRIVGGALLGDISSAGRLHQMMTCGPLDHRLIEEFLEPGSKAISRNSASCRGYRRQATMLSFEGVG